MASITASMVKELREKSGAGMMDCKKMLTATEGNMDDALTKLREKGLAAAQKKSGRVAAEGLIGIATEGAFASMVEVNCETDFVAKNPEFQKLVSDLANQALNMKDFASNAIQNGDVLASQAFLVDSSKTVEEAVKSKIATIGENISLRRFVKLADGDAYGTYSHGGGSIGTIVRLKLADPSKAKSEGVATLAKDLAMHVAAAAPLGLNKDELDEDVVAKERAIFKQQVLDQGKPENIVDKIVDGKMNRFFKESCMLDQLFVKDNDVTVAKLLENVSKEVGTTVELTGFARFKVGEGIEKKSEDFADEVAKMTK